MSRALISPALRLGKASRSSAAEPLTMGAAPDVPPNGVVPVPVPASAEIEAPGAPISGLTMFVSMAGPRDDEPTMVPINGRPCAGSNRTVTAPAARALLSASEVLWWTMKPGMSMQASLGHTPNAPLNGSPGATRPMTPASPPASAMLAICSLKLQMPRSTRTIRPVRSTPSNGFGRFGPEPPAAVTRHPVRFPVVLPSKKSGNCSATVSSADHSWWTAGYGPRPDGDTTSRSGRTADGTSVCATDSALGACAGEGRVRVVDAAIENRDGDAGSCEAGTVERIGADVRDRFGEVELVVDDRLDRLDRRIAGELVEPRGVDAQGDRVDRDLRLPQHWSAGAGDERVLLGRDRLKLLLLCAGVGAGGRDFGDRVVS